MAKREKKAAPDVAPVVDVAVVELGEDAGLLGGFLSGLGEWFSGLRTLQTRAENMEAASRVWQRPTTKAEDAALIVAVREARAAVKEAEAHCDVATRLHRLHRRITGERDKATKPLDILIERGTRLHAEYEAAERRRVEEEERQRRLQAEREAEEKRQRELAELEAAALKAEEASPDLSDRERVFVDRVHNLGEELAWKAAQIAGYKNPTEMAARLLATPKIRAALEALATVRAARRQAEAVRETPVTPAYVPPVEAQLNTGTRYTHAAEFTNAALFVQACLDGKVPRMVALAVLQPNGPAMNAQAKAFKDAVNEWPGVRYVKKPVVV